MNVDPVANEIYIADGYLNKRVIVFDSNTGTYKRHWGAYGNVPSDEKWRTLIQALLSLQIPCIVFA